MENSCNIYGDAHRMFVQSMMKRKILNSDEFTNLFKICCKRCNLKLSENPSPKKIQEEKKEFLETINRRINKVVGLKLKNITDEINNQRHLVLTSSRTSDKTFRIAQYSTPELDYLKVLVEMIITSRSKHINSMDTINAHKHVQSKKLSLSQADEILTKFYDNQWLKKEQFGGDFGPVFVRLHPRFIAECETWLQNTYPDDIQECSIPKCGKIVIKSIDCAKCKIGFHKNCIFTKKPKGFKSGHCPKCKSEINLKMIERNEAMEARGLASPRKSPAKKPTRKRKKADETESESEYESSESE